MVGETLELGGEALLIPAGVARGAKKTARWLLSTP